MKHLKTKRLTLKPLTDGDQAAVVEILTDETVGKTYMVPEFTSEEMAVRLFRRPAIKIALASARLVDRDVSYNISQMKRFMTQAKQQGAELVCFGESFLQGFECLDWDYETDQHMAVTVDSELFASVCQLSRTIQIDVLFGFIERVGEAMYSSCALVSEGELYHLYRRISRGWKEYSRTDEHYREGDVVETFLYKRRKCAIGLCGDLWDYPERFALGEDILFWPVYVSWEPDEWEESITQEYADQAKLCCGHTLYVNSICDGDACGGSVYFVDGAVKAELPMGEEGLLFVEV